MLVQPTQRGARLADNAVHRNLGRKGVARDRDIEAVGERSFGDEAEALLWHCVASSQLWKNSSVGAPARFAAKKSRRVRGALP